jgi:tRNA nucleotidyltransferase/poly(A) polymerase
LGGMYISKKKLAAIRSRFRALTRSVKEFEGALEEKQLNLEEAHREITRVTLARDDAEHMALKAWDEHRFAVERIGALNREMGVLTACAKNAVRVALDDQKAQIVKALNEVAASYIGLEIRNLYERTAKAVESGDYGAL